MSELDEDKIAGVEFGFGRVPTSFGDVGSGAASSSGAVSDVDSGGVKMCADHGRPTPEAVFPISIAVSDGGVADHEEGCFGRVQAESCQ